MGLVCTAPALSEVRCVAEAGPFWAGNKAVLQRTAVVVLDWQGLQFDALKAAHVDRSHGFAIRSCALAKGMNAALWAEMMLDHVFVECVGAHCLRFGQEAKVFAGDEPEQGAFALTHGAVAGHDPVNLALRLESDLATMAASAIFHIAFP